VRGQRRVRARAAGTFSLAAVFVDGLPSATRAARGLRIAAPINGTSGGSSVKRLQASFVVIVLLAVAAPARGQVLDSPYRFMDSNQHAGVYAGWAFASTGRLDMGPQPAPAFGARWGIRVTGPFVLGAEVGWMPSTRTVRDTMFVAADSLYREIAEANINVLTVMGNLVFHITGARTWNNLAPFALLGAGAAIGSGTRAPEETDLAAEARFNFGTSFAGQIGAGVDWFPSPRLSLRLDGRNALWKLGIPEAFLLTDAGRTLPRSEWEQNFIVSAGLSIHF
jgi:hypothetical protein